MENLGIECLTGHVPRHTYANHMAYAGHSEEEIRITAMQKFFIALPKNHLGYLFSPCNKLTE
jgi:hypothetical protein